MNIAATLGLRSTTARFAALAFLVLLLSSVAVLGVGARLASRALETELIEQSRAEVREIAIAFRRSGPAAAAALLRAELAQSPQKITLLEGPRGRLAGNAQAWPPTLGTPTDWRELVLYAQGSSRPERYGVVAIALGGGYRLFVGHSLAERARLLRSFVEALLGATAAALALAIAGAWALSHFIANRVRATVEAAAAVAAGDLSRRVPVTDDDDAFNELALALNAMLARIDSLVSELRIVTDSLAHDLRSPLTRMKSRLERAALEEDPESARAALEAVATEADALLRIVTLALEVSRAEAGLGREHHDAIDATALLTDLAEIYRPLAEDAGVAIEVQAPAKLTILGHRELLGQALANLIDNALKHSGAQVVRLTAQRLGDQASLAVSDDGRGIPPEKRAQALARFARLDTARSTPGAGLGLSLAAAVARMHGGELRLSDRTSGLHVEFDVPVAAG